MPLKLMSLEESRALDASPDTAHRYWYAALRGEILPTHPEYVPCGFYRQDRKDGTAIPLAIWLDENGQKCTQEGMWPVKVLSTPKIEGAFAYDTFQYSAKKAITYEAYEHWKKHRSWPESEGARALIEESKKARRKPVAKADPVPAATPAAAPAAAEPGIGHNSGEDPAIEHETFVDQVQAVLAGAKALMTVATDEQAAEASSLRNRLNELASEGAKKHEVEKKPHLDAGRAVDQRWNPIIKDARAGASKLRAAIEAHANEKARKKREEEAALAAAANPVTEAPKPERIEAAYGKSVTVKTRKQARVVDYDAVYQALRENADIKALLDKLAQRVTDAGGVLKGVEVTDVASIR